MKYFLLFFCFSVSAQIETREMDVITETGDRGLAIEKAIQQVSRDFVRHLMGEEKYKEHQKRIEKKIIKNKNRYILSAKTSAPKEQEEGNYLTKVTLGVSSDNLTALLLEHNLFYASSGASCVLPAITFKTNDKKSGRKMEFSWWEESKEESSLLQNLSGIFYSALSEDFIQAGFYVIDPVFARLSKAMPSSALPSSSSARQFQKFVKFLGCDLILSGTFKVEKNLFLSSLVGEFHLKVFHMKTLRELFSFKKRVIFPAVEKDLQKGFRASLPSVLNSLKYQLSFYKDRGVLDLNRFFISIQGPLTYHQKDQLKAALIQKIPAIKDLKEALIVSNRILYEVEASQDMKALAKEIRSSRFSLFKVQITGYNQKKLDLYAKIL